jgi:hypothetical protein
MTLNGGPFQSVGVEFEQLTQLLVACLNNFSCNYCQSNLSFDNKVRFYCFLTHNFFVCAFTQFGTSFLCKVLFHVFSLYSKQYDVYAQFCFY